MQIKECIVSPEVAGPSRKGGIGAQVVRLADAMVQAKRDVTIILTSSLDIDELNHWKAHFANNGIAFMWIGDLDDVAGKLELGFPLFDSLRLYRFLRDQDFDVIHFQDWMANGFHCIQAKRLGYAFLESSLTVNLRGATEWLLAESQQWPEQPFASARLQWCERYCCEHCDVVISPSEFMLDWVRERNWKLAVNTRVIPGIAEAIEDVSDKADADRKAWLNVSADLTPRVSRKLPKRMPKVSVCVPYYNHGRFFDALVDNMCAIEYPELEVIIVDDGSTDEESRQLFDREMERPRDNRLKLFRKMNGGVGSARNHAVEMSTGDLLYFFDSDNTLELHALTELVEALIRTDLDCVASLYRAVDENKALPFEMSDTLYVSFPTGQWLEGGAVKNVYGDAAFLVKKSVYNELGGQQTDRSVAFEDWEFLVRLALKGYRQEVLPEFHYWYRHCADSMMRSYGAYRSHLSIISAYAGHAGLLNDRVFRDFLVPQFYKEDNYDPNDHLPDWLGQARNEGYEGDVRFVARFLQEAWLGRLIRKSSVINRGLELLISLISPFSRKK